MSSIVSFLIQQAQHENKENYDTKTAHYYFIKNNSINNSCKIINRYYTVFVSLQIVLIRLPHCGQPLQWIYAKII